MPDGTDPLRASHLESLHSIGLMPATAPIPDSIPEIVWLYLREKGSLTTMERGDLRLRWDMGNNPEGMVMIRQSIRSNDWRVAYWGTTEEEVIERVNAFVNKKIAECEVAIALLKQQLVVRPPRRRVRDVRGRSKRPSRL